MSTSGAEAERCQKCGEYLTIYNCYFDHGMARAVCKKRPSIGGELKQSKPDLWSEVMRLGNRYGRWKHREDEPTEKEMFDFLDGFVPATLISIEAIDLLLQEAHHKVRGAREKEYGNKLKNFTDIAAIQTIVSGMKRTAESVALDMICVKLARLLKSPDHYDTLVDLVGYVLCYRDIRRERNPDQYTMEEERFRHELKTDKPPQSGI